MNNTLSCFNLLCFQHRVINTLTVFSYDLYNEIYSPTELKSQFILNYNFNIGYELRNLNLLTIFKYNNYGFETFGFFCQFINIFIINDINLKPKLFKIVFIL